ncbi:MAG: hypothetical protein RIR97_1596 [Pseudomonadota bacterium]
MRRTTNQTASWVRILCAIALLSVGFAHKPVMAFAAPLSENAAYQLPDGSFADLCIADASGNHKGKMTDHGCEACRLSASILVPTAPANASDILRISSDILVSERPESIRHRLYPPNSGPRAPPIS